MRRKRKLPMLIFLGCCGCFLFLFFWIEQSLEETIVSFALAEANWRATEAIHQAVIEEIGASSLAYQELIYLEKNQEGQVVFMQPDVIKLNKLAAEITLSVQNRLQALSNQYIFIPWGQILGSKLLAAYGPKIELTLLPVGTVGVRLEDKFEAAGINQVRHQIYLNVASRVKIVIPLIAREVPVETKLLLAEAVITGPVPQFYLNYTP